MARAFGYKFHNFFMEYGPVYADSEQEAKAAIRRRLGVGRLPWGLQVWDLSRRPLKVWRASEAC